MVEQVEIQYVDGDAPAITTKDIDESDFYIARLVENAKVWSEREYAAGRVQVWRQVFEHLDAKYEDGNAVKSYQPRGLFLQNPRTGAPIWKGSNASKVADSYLEVVGESLLPDDIKEAYPDDDPFVGGVFKMRTLTIPGEDYEDKATGETRQGRPTRLQIPIEFLGKDYVYAGSVRTITPRANGTQQVTAPVDGGPDAGDDPAIVSALVALLDGKELTNLKALVGVMATHAVLGPVTKMFGQSLRGGIYAGADGTLLGKLQSRGLIDITDDGRIIATDSRVHA